MVMYIYVLNMYVHSYKCVKMCLIVSVNLCAYVCRNLEGVRECECVCMCSYINGHICV